MTVVLVIHATNGDVASLLASVLVAGVLAMIARVEVEARHLANKVTDVDTRLKAVEAKAKEKT